MTPAVRQKRGPGMNKGMKKPRKKPGEPKPYTPSREMKKALAGAIGSLPKAEGKSRKGRNLVNIPGLT